MPLSDQTSLLEPDEQVYVVLREHWFMLASRLLVWVVFVAVILVVDGFLKTYAAALYGGKVGVILSILRSTLLLLAALGVFMTWAMYYLNVQIITNKRIIDIDQKSVLRHETSELHLQKVEDVSTEIKGLLQNFLDFGNVIIQTAGEKEKFIFETVAHPNAITRLILDLYEKVAPVSETAIQKKTTVDTTPTDTTNTTL